MKFDYCSDLHVDIWRKNFRWSKYNIQSPILVVAGDISNSIKRTKSVLKDAADHYEHVIFVDGNHEHYEFSETVRNNCYELLDFSFSYEANKISYLDGSHKIIGTTLFVGANGWYDWKMMESLGYDKDECEHQWAIGSNDSRIDFGDDVSPPYIASQQIKDLVNLVKHTQESNLVKDIVVVTHTVPVEKGLWIKKDDDAWNRLTASYGNSEYKRVLEADTNKKIRVWIYGHTHTASEIVQDGIKYLCNARGYPMESKSPWKLKQVEV